MLLLSNMNTYFIGLRFALQFITETRPSRINLLRGHHHTRIYGLRLSDEFEDNTVLEVVVFVVKRRPTKN